MIYTVEEVKSSTVVNKSLIYANSSGTRTLESAAFSNGRIYKSGSAFDIQYYNDESRFKLFPKRWIVERMFLRLEIFKSFSRDVVKSFKFALDFLYST